jgi:hypothetical protein
MAVPAPPRQRRERRVVAIPGRVTPPRNADMTAPSQESACRDARAMLGRAERRHQKRERQKGERT